MLFKSLAILYLFYPISENDLNQYAFSLHAVIKSALFAPKIKHVASNHYVHFV